jgi:uncharacterized membrane protein
MGEGGVQKGHRLKPGGEEMKLEPTPYSLYMLFMALLNIIVLASPFIMLYYPSIGEPLHYGFSFACHQLASRSYCFYPEDGSLGNCPDEYTRAPILDSDNGPAYKFHVCARDLPLYLAAFIGGIAVYFTKWKDAKRTPNPVFFILALIPIALDGGTQLIGLRESTNELRAITGAIAGFAFSFYFIPMLNAFFLKKEDAAKPPTAEKETRKKK